jgi:Tfp pilus assembly protein PilP
MKKSALITLLTLTCSCLWLTAQQKSLQQDKGAASSKAAAQAPEPVAKPGTPAPAPVAPAGDMNYKYEVKGRRDPFRPLDAVTTFQATQAPIVRPPGLKGQLVSEIKLVGIIKSSTGTVAMVQGYRSRSFFLHPNDTLYDGKVVEVRKDAVVFSQILKDAQGKSMTQQIIKKLQPTRGEGK